MAKIKIICRFCRGEHKFSPKKFPLVLYGNQEVFEGRGKKRKSLGWKKVVIGYACKKCYAKARRMQFVEKHQVRQRPGQRISEAIREKTKILTAGMKARMKRGQREILAEKERRNRNEREK